MGAYHEGLIFRKVAVVEGPVDFHRRASSYKLPVGRFGVRGQLRGGELLRILDLILAERGRLLRRIPSFDVACFSLPGECRATGGEGVDRRKVALSCRWRLSLSSLFVADGRGKA